MYDAISQQVTNWEMIGSGYFTTFEQIEALETAFPMALDNRVSGLDRIDQFRTPLTSADRASRRKTS
jgi:hypothetical protein